MRRGWGEGDGAQCAGCELQRVHTLLLLCRVFPLPMCCALTWLRRLPARPQVFEVRWVWERSLGCLEGGGVQGCLTSPPTLIIPAAAPCCSVTANSGTGAYTPPFASQSLQMAPIMPVSNCTRPEALAWAMGSAVI